MNNQQTGEDNTESFISYYRYCIFLIIINLLLFLSFFFLPKQYDPLVIIVIFIFSIYRWYVSRWTPKILDPKSAFSKQQHYYEQRSIINRAEGIVTADTGPGIIDKVYYWIMSKFLSIIAMFIVWLPMEFVIQISHIIKARTAWKEGNLLLSRRGLWPGKEKISPRNNTN